MGASAVCQNETVSAFATARIHGDTEYLTHPCTRRAGTSPGSADLHLDWDASWCGCLFSRTAQI